MKKRWNKTIIASILLVGILAIPVFAQEVTDPEKVIKEETFTTGEDALAAEFHNSQIWRSNNYLGYLDGVIYNLNETVRIKQEIVNNYKWLARYNSSFKALIPGAEKDLEQAKAWVDYYKAYKIKAQAALKSKYNY